MKYLKVRLRLTKILVCRGCGEEADVLADEAIDRVTKKLKAGEVPQPFIGDKAIYFCSFVNNICHEHFRERQRRECLPSRSAQPLVLVNPNEIDDECACLEKCMAALDERERWAVIEYYRFEKGAKIEHRKQIARKLGINLKALRLRVYRIRVQLRCCIEFARQTAVAKN